MAETSKLVLVTFVGRSKAVKNVKKSLKETVLTAQKIMPKTGQLYNICEHYDTYIKGGLYPLLHLSRDAETIEAMKRSGDYLEEWALGDRLSVDQALFEEVHAVEPPHPNPAKDSVLTVAAFKSLDDYPSPILIEKWKSWTGARAFMTDIGEAGLQCLKMSFFVRQEPLQGEDVETQGFYYMLVTEVGIREPSDEGLIVDVLQRFRVERWSGYQTIYRPYNP